MTLVIGLDTGGTFTDAALLDAESGTVLATGKSLTTREDLSIGLGGAISKTLDAYDGDRRNIGLVSLSTTLATNAVVEGVGGRVCLIMIGFDEAALERADLARALGQDPVYFINGGHRADGGQQAPLDRDSLTTAITSIGKEVSAFAVASHFATRNPSHETEARRLIRDLTGCPVTCSHELSSSLGGPRRALTAILNARLINLLERLIVSTETIMTSQGLDCPLMVVKGDGSLLHSDFARTRPVETVLSGPAASLSGAAFLAGTKTALIADIGGTTTDVAFLQNGAPRLKPDGAFVGGWQTMVEAAEIRTCGLGGDSEVQPISRGRATGITLGPRRAIPLSILAQSWPEVKKLLKAQLDLIVPMATDGRFVIPLMPDGIPTWLTRSEARLAQKALETGPSAVADLAATQLALGAVDRLVSRGLLSLASFTPTDAAHVTGDFTDFDAEAACLGAALMARQKNGFGDQIADDEIHIARMTLAELHRKSALALTDAAFAHDGAGENIASSHPLLSDIYTPQLAGQNNDDAQASLLADNQPKKLVSVSMQLDTSLIALGASAGTHYPHIASLMNLDLTVPAHADVAGAVGAAAGSVRQRVMISVTQPNEGKFRVHLPDGPVDMGIMEDALTRARDAAHQLASDRAKNAGASKIDVTLTEDIKLVTLSADNDLFIEALIYATAEGHAA